MEEKINKLRFMIGPKFVSFNGSWCIALNLYWFSLMFFKRWHPDIFYYDGSPSPWSGFVFNYNLNPVATEGDLIWLNSKKWLWPSHPKGSRHAA